MQIIAVSSNSISSELDHKNYRIKTIELLQKSNSSDNHLCNKEISNDQSLYLWLHNFIQKFNWSGCEKVIAENRA